MTLTVWYPVLTRYPSQSHKKLHNLTKTWTDGFFRQILILFQMDTSVSHSSWRLLRDSVSQLLPWDCGRCRCYWTYLHSLPHTAPPPSALTPNLPTLTQNLSCSPPSSPFFIVWSDGRGGCEERRHGVGDVAVPEVAGWCRTKFRMVLQLGPKVTGERVPQRFMNVELQNHLQNESS